jgi:putative salt-induced outer membrane protein YdiY
MKKIALAITGIFTLAGIASHAQVPAAAVPAAAAAAKPVGTRVNLGASLTDGNSDTQTLNAEILNDGICPFGNDYSIGALYNFGEANGDTNVENAKAFLALRRTIAAPLYGYLKADGITDDVAGIDYRVTVGPGLGTVLMKSDAAELDVEAGAAWIKEKLTTDEVGSAGTTVEDDYVALRVGQSYKRTLSKTSRAWQSVEWLPSFDDFSGNYLLNAEIGIESDIVEGISLRLVAKDAYDSEPAAGREDNDLSLVAGLGIRL